MQSLDKFPKCCHSISFRDFCFKKYCILQLYWSIRVCPLPGRCVYGVLLYRRPPVQSPRFTQRPSWGKSLQRSKPNINQTKQNPNQTKPNQTLLKPNVTQTKTYPNQRLPKPNQTVVCSSVQCSGIQWRAPQTLLKIYLLAI